MKLFTTLTSLFLLVSSTMAAVATISFDEFYDNASEPLTSVECSDGPYGLMTKGFTTFGSLPSFPGIGGTEFIPGYGSPNCGSCWKLTYQGRSITVLAIDHARTGFTISLAAMDELTGGQAVSLGRINADATRVSPAQCGL